MVYLRLLARLLFLNHGRKFLGFYLNFDKEILKLVATDSFRLAEKTISQASNLSQPISLIVPQRTIQELIRILAKNQIRKCG